MDYIATRKINLPNGETVYYREKGQGDVLLLLHGNMTSSFHLEKFIQGLPNDIRVIAPDMRGFGQSSYRTSITSLSDFADDIAQLINMLRIEKVTVAGWSTGGGVAIQYALDYPDNVDGLVLISSVGLSGYPLLKSYPNGQPTEELILSKQEIVVDPVLSNVLTAFEQRNRDFVKMLWSNAVYNHNKPDPQLFEQYIDDVLTQRNLADVYYALASFNISDSDNGVVVGNGRCSELKVPTLILHGRDDLVIPVATAQATHQTLSNNHSNVTLIRYPQCGHSLFVDIPNELHHELVAFISRLNPNNA